MKKSMQKVLALSCVWWVIGCTGGGAPKLSAQPNVEIIQDMMESPALKAQDFDTFNREKGSSRIPPEGSVAIGKRPYKFALDPEAAKSLKNPLGGNMAPEVLSVGQRSFETYCSVCHGGKGLGDGPVAAKWAGPIPALVSEKVIGMSDGSIFHVITAGQGIMGSYAHQLTNERDRWAIVNYVRNLQKIDRSK